MKGVIWPIAMGIAAALWTAPAFADAKTAIETGNELLSACRTDGWQSGYCTGYILGVYRGIEAYDTVKNTRTFCGDEHGTVEQAVLVVEQYMTSHAKVMSQSSEWVVILALMDAFPCTKS